MVIRALEIVSLERGLPERIRVDNGPEYFSSELAEYCAVSGVELDFIETSNLQLNAYVERINRTFREDVEDTNALMSLGHAQDFIDGWRDDYISSHPHSALDDLSLLAYRQSQHYVSHVVTRYTLTFPSSLHSNFHPSPKKLNASR